MISVIIPTYNSSKYISSCLSSVFNQTYKNIEVIVVDDCSEDNTVEIIKQQYPKTKIIEMESNSGSPAAPRNKGLKAARGDYVCFLDSDDLWIDSKLETQLKLMTEKKLMFSSCSGYTIDEQGNEINKINPRVKKNSPLTLKDLLKCSFVITSSVMIRNVRCEWVKFNDNVMFKNCAEDLSLWLEFHYRYPFKSICMQDALVKYRDVSGSVSDDVDKLSSCITRDICVINFLSKNKEYKKIVFYKIYSVALFLFYFVRSE
ncbi:TPA: glycosyltransferase family 2 protein [Vibrio harveyi]|nr:glycosyltransferase family 2 protein [Vibrio harveyi]